MSPLQPLLLSAFTLVVGMLLIVLASTVVQGHNGWPLLCLTFYAFSPVPFFLCGWGSTDYTHRLSLFRMLGAFIGGACVASGPGLALMLYHLGSISRSALLLTLASGCCFLGSAWILLSSSSEESDDDIEEDDLFG